MKKPGMIPGFFVGKRTLNFLRECRHSNYSIFVTAMSLHQVDIPRKHSLLLAIILAAIAFLYIYRLGDKSLDFDERYSMNIATGIGGATSQYTQFGRFIANPIPGATFSSAQYRARNTLPNVVSTAMNDNGQGLPYFMMLHGWLKVFGVSVFAARLLAAIIMLVSLILFYRLLLSWQLSSATAIIATVLLATNGVVIGLAQYVRFYTLGILLTVLSTLLVSNLVNNREDKKLRLLLGVVWGLMLLNQFFAGFIIAAQGLLLLNLNWKTKPVRMFVPVLGGFLLPVLIWLTAFGGWESLRNIYTLHQGERLAISELTMPASFLNSSAAVIASLVSATGQPVRILDSVHSVSMQLLPGLPALLLIGASIYALKKLLPQWAKLSLLVLAVYILASVVHTTLTGHTLLFQGRYWVFAYVFSYALLGYALAWGWCRKGWSRRLAVIVLCLSLGRAAYTSASVVSGLSIGPNKQLVPSYVQAYEDYEGVAKTIVTTARPGDTISYDSWTTAQRVNWFMLQRPQILQRVDTLQLLPVILANGSAKNEVIIGKGRAKGARPPWLHAAAK